MYLKNFKGDFEFQLADTSFVFSDLANGARAALELRLQFFQFTGVPTDGAFFALKAFDPTTFPFLRLREATDPFTKVFVEVAGVLTDGAHSFRVANRSTWCQQMCLKLAHHLGCIRRWHELRSECYAVAYRSGSSCQRQLAIIIPR